MTIEALVALGIDEGTASAWELVPLTDDADVTQWSDALRRALESSRNDGADDWDAVRAHVEAATEEAGLDRAAVEWLIEHVESTGLGTEGVVRMVEAADAYPDLYTRVQLAAEPPPTVAGGSPAAWVPQDYQATLAAWWDSEWPDTLSGHLEERWGSGWQEHPDEHKAAWLGDLMLEWSGAPAEGSQSGTTAGSEPAEPEASAADVGAEPLSPEVAADMVEQALAELMEEIDGAEDLSAEELAEIRAELVAELTVPAG